MTRLNNYLGLKMTFGKAVIRMVNLRKRKLYLGKLKRKKLIRQDHTLRNLFISTETYLLYGK